MQTGCSSFEGILRAYDRKAPAAERVKRSNWSFAGGSEHLAALAEFSRIHAERLANHLIQRALIERASRERALLALYQSGLVLGIGDPRTTEGRLAAVFQIKEGAWQHAPEEWRILAHRLEERRAKLRTTVTSYNQVRQGAGGELGLATNDVTSLLQETEGQIELPEDPEDDPAYRDLRLLLGNRLGPALESVRQQLGEWRDAVRPALGAPESWPSTEKQLLEVDAELRAHR